MTHSVMFHHFHDEKHLPAQGSLSSSDLLEMIGWLRKHYSIVNASQYKDSLAAGKLRDADICLSFDDGLKCQYDVAAPVLESEGIEAYFNVYSSAFDDEPEPLEIFRYFRTSYFSDIDDFYMQFFEILERIDAPALVRERARYSTINYLSAFPFYSENDKWFRYLRDNFLGADEYNLIMRQLMLDHNFDMSAAKENLWMSEGNIVDLESKGHIIGLHSYSHPTKISRLSKHEQKLEYRKNFDHLSGLLGKPITAMAHPCGDYNETTIEILKEMSIEIGFRSNMAVKEIRSSLEIPREDHANVFSIMRS